MQVNSQDGNVGGFFYASVTGQEPYTDIWHGCLEFVSLCDLIQTFPSHRDASSWKAVIEKYANQYLGPYP